MFQELLQYLKNNFCLSFEKDYSVGEEKNPYFLFHRETALHKILKFQGETANFLEKGEGSQITRIGLVNRGGKMNASE